MTDTTHDNPQTRRIAEFVSSLQYEQIPQEVIRRIKLLILDSAGCALYAASLPWSRILQESLRPSIHRREVAYGVRISGCRHRMLLLSTVRKCKASNWTTCIARACCTWVPSFCPH